MISLCGATAIIETLRSYFKKPGKKFNFMGFGVWNRNDDDLLQCVLCSEHIEEKLTSPYTIKTLENPLFDELLSYRLLKTRKRIIRRLLRDIRFLPNKPSRHRNHSQKAIPSYYPTDRRICPYSRKPCETRMNLINISEDGKNTSTNRIIRCYEGYGASKPTLLYRTDWELPVQPMNTDLFDAKLSNKKVTAVIIQDHGKGVVTSDTVKALIEALKPHGNESDTVKWYIRTKLKNPAWMQDLTDNDILIRLQVGDQKLAGQQTGMRRCRFGTKIGRSSLEILGTMTRDMVFKHGRLTQISKRAEEIKKDIREKLDGSKIEFLKMANSENFVLVLETIETIRANAMREVDKMEIEISKEISKRTLNDPATTRQTIETVSKNLSAAKTGITTPLNKLTANNPNHIGDPSKQSNILKDIEREMLSIVEKTKYETLKDIAIEETNHKAKKIAQAAIIFDDNTAVAKSGDQCFNIDKSIAGPSLINIGRTTMFFSALVAQDLEDQTTDFGIQCYRALKVASSWSEKASDAWNKEEPHFYGDYSTALNKLSSNDDADYRIEPENYRELWDEWNDSSKELGLITKIEKNDKIQKTFQVWRGEGSLKKYICVGGPKRDAINDLQGKIQKFINNKNSMYPFNILLIASPGWGKSFLANLLAESFDMIFLSFSLSQMATTRDLIDCFDTICSTQNSTDKKVLVFIDEINCSIEGHDAMGLLLSPIWDGSFVRDGKFYKLKPAVWIFASTETPRSDGRSYTDKTPDFMSRLNGPVIELDKLAAESNKSFSEIIKLYKEAPYKGRDLKTIANQLFNIQGEFRTEQVYLGVSLINKIWGPVSKIQEDVLQLFHDMLIINGYRSLEFFVSQFSNIERGIVMPSNVPVTPDNRDMRRHVFLPDTWVKEIPGDNSNRLVPIEMLTP